MRYMARKSFFILMATSFVATVTGVSLQLHLLSQNDHHKHAPDECSICQKFLNSFGKFTRESKSELPEANPLKYDSELPLHICITTLHHNSFSPRPPPLV